MSIAAANGTALSNPQTNQVLAYNAATVKWVNTGMGIINVSGLQAELDTKAELDHVHLQADITGLAALLAQVPIVIRHGSNANFSRPSVANPAFWLGSVAPQNIIDGDVYWKTTTSNPAVFTGASMASRCLIGRFHYVAY